jgi:hypothetical protein
MTTRRQFVEMTRTFNAEISEHEIGGYDAWVDLPTGWIWNANGLHNLTTSVPYLWKGAKSECYADLVEQMRYGATQQNCGDPGCDVCVGGELT